MADVESVLNKLTDRGVIVEPLHLKNEFMQKEDEEHVYRTVAIPLWGWVNDRNYIRVPITPYRIGAKAWVDYVQTQHVNPLVFMLQLMMLLMESTSLEGGFTCNINAQTNPKEYHEICVITAKTLKGLATKDEWKRRREHVFTNSKVDLKFTHDVGYEKMVLDAQKKKKKTTKKKKKKQEKKKTTKKKKQGKKRKLTEKDTVDSRFVEFNMDFVRFSNVGGNVAFIEEEVQDNEEENEEEENNEEENEEEEDEEEENNEEEEVHIEKPPYFGPEEAVDKISMTITEIPHEDDESLIMGLLVFFIIRDPAINPGVFYEHCMENLNMRKIRKVRAQTAMLKPEMFPDYENFMLSFLPAGNRTTLETYTQCIQLLYPDFVTQHYTWVGQFLDRVVINADTPAHIWNLLTPEFAIQNLRDANGSSRILRRASNWVNRKEGLVTFPQEGARTWKPRHMAVLWYSPIHLGFSNHFFPFVDMNSDFLQSLSAGVNMTDYLNGSTDGQPKENKKLTKIEQLLSRNALVLKKSIAAQRSLGYETSNEFIYANREASVVYSCVDSYYPEQHYADTLVEVQTLVARYGQRWREFLDDDLKQHVEECELYNSILNKAQDSLTERFCSIVKLDENVEALNISDPLRRMVEWYQKVHETKLPHMSRPYACYDPDLDPFGNTMLQHLFIFTRFAQILQPIICLLSEGLFSCYDAFQEELSYHQMIHGRYDVGKTYTAINILRNFSTIPGTITEQPMSTKAADTTHKHSHDEIVVTDECPDWIVNEAEARKNRDLVNKEKVKMTRGQLVQKTFLWLELPGGRRVRWNEDVTTDHKKACVFVTNEALESKKALSSRMHRLIMKQPNVSASEMDGYVDETLKTDTKMWLHINQFMSAMSKKLACVGGIRPEVEMKLFKEISSRVVKYLTQHNAIGNEAGQRSLEIMKPFLRQLVYKMAIRYAFDFEWSENYERKFSLEQLRAIQPFLYVTVSQIWFVWTACASEWINDDYCNVLQAMLAETSCEWKEGDTCYSVYERDTKDSVKFKTFENRYYEKSDIVQDKFKIDLNYMVLEGSEDNIAQRVSQHTNPKLEPDQVKSIFKRLSEIQKRPEKCGYEPQLKGTLARWHKWVESGGQMVKETGNGCPKNFLYNNPNWHEFRGEDDIPRLSEGATLSVIDRSDILKKKIYFLPNVAHFFKQQMIIDALSYATICASTQPGKYLLGFPAVGHTTRLDIHPWRRQQLDDFMKECDVQMGFELQRDGSWKSKNPHAVSRREGIILNRCAALSDEDIKMATAVPFAPKPVGDTSWKTKYTDGANAMSKNREIVYDLDVLSAQRQHMRCGRPLDEPVRTPQWIKEKTGNKSFDIDYPCDEVHTRSKLEDMWNNSVGSNPGYKSEALEEIEKTKHMSRKEYQVYLAQKQRGQNRVGQHQEKRPRIYVDERTNN
jgi:hypothetical protein